MQKVSTLMILFTMLPLLINNYENLDWDSFKTRYSKSYATAEEDQERQDNYNSNKGKLDAIQASIAANSLGYTVNINQFSDWTDDQLRILMNGVKQKTNPRGDNFNDYKTGKVFGRRRLAASSLNWKSQITGVKDQGQGCASAWAFAVAAMCEAGVILKEGQTHNFAEQYLLQCSGYSNCNGGYLEYALDKVINKNGLPSQSKYAYNPDSSYSGICSTNSMTFVSQFYYSFYGLSDGQIIQLLQNGPVAVSVSSEGWNHYSSGVYECSQNPNIDHAALLVGYTSTYWYLKNSWGIGWGQTGYIKVSRTRSKNCGIGKSVFALTQPSLIYITTVFLILCMVLLL